MTSDEPWREYWITGLSNESALMSGMCYAHTEKYENSIHVIDHAALDAANERIRELESQLSVAREALAKNKKVWDFYCEFETLEGVNSDEDLIHLAIEATSFALTKLGGSGMGE